MAITCGAVTVATTATLLSGADTDTVAGQTVYLTNNGDQAVFIGPASVTGAEDGYPIEAGESLPWPLKLGSGEALYGIVAATTASVAVVRTGV